MSTPHCVPGTRGRHVPHGHPARSTIDSSAHLVSVRTTRRTLLADDLQLTAAPGVWQIYGDAEAVTTVSRVKEGGRHMPYFAKSLPAGRHIYENAVDSCMPLADWMSFSERSGVPYTSGIADAYGRVHYSSKYSLQGDEYNFLSNPHLTPPSTLLHEWCLCDWSHECNVVFDEHTRRFVTCRDVKLGEVVMLGLKSDVDNLEEANLQELAAALFPHLIGSDVDGWQLPHPTESEGHIDEWEFLADPAPINP